MSPATAVRVFACFAGTYFFSALVRGVTATLAPVFSADLGLQAADLGLLAGAYFFGFAIAQLPLGGALDRWGGRRVLVWLLAAAVLGCVAFALAPDFTALTLARALIGLGVSACLMAPMTTFRRAFRPTAQLRANSWMLMSGSLGMVASTLPVQWLLPVIGWRGLFWGLALMFALAALAILAWVPADDEPDAGPQRAAHGRHPPVAAVARPVLARLVRLGGLEGYGEVFRHPTFRRYLPMGLVHYGGLIAVQSLWAGPWLVAVTGLTPAESARGLFLINLCMLGAFLAWGTVTPALVARGWSAPRLIARGVPFSLLLLFACALGGPATGAVAWAAFCVSCTVVSLSQPAIGQAFPATLAGRALSAYNLAIFLGVFMIQWGMGWVIDVGRAAGASVIGAYQAAVGLLAVLATAAYLWFLWAGRGDGSRQAQEWRPSADI